MTRQQSLTAGDETRLKAIISEYNSDIFRYCYSILCNASDAEDAAQATYIKLWRAFDRLNEGVVTKALIYKIAYRVSVDIIRKRRFLLLPDAGEAVRGSYFDVVDEGFPEELKKALLSLSAKDRALLISRSVNGVSYEDLSQVFGCSAQTLRKRYERLRKRVCTLLQENSNCHKAVIVATDERMK